MFEVLIRRFRVINKNNFLSVLDLLGIPFVYIAAILLREVRKIGVYRLPMSRKILLKVGCFPIRDHYYEPLYNYGKHLRFSLSQERSLPGINWNIQEQIEILREFHYNEELKSILDDNGGGVDFCLTNGSFEGGDADFFYNVIRLKQPSRIFEIGSGNSTRIAIKAIRKNEVDLPGYKCKHVCIEPYEMPWLEGTGVKVIRDKVETVGKEFFSELDKEDILFIDSSHIIRPQGDVLFEYLELLPSLKAGVIVHIHDIFSPCDYKSEWLMDDVRFWNEQYLLEAFLTSNKDWKIIAAVNFLKHNYYDQLVEKCPFLSSESEPASFYIQKDT